MADPYDVAIVGGGPAGAATAAVLASEGFRVVVFERHAAAEWRACGVFSSPLVRRRLSLLGLPAERIAALEQPISTMELESHGAACTLEYSRGLASGWDRVALDAALLDLAARNGAEIRRATVVRDVRLPDGRGQNALVSVSSLDAASPPFEELGARVVVGADGGGSKVARAAGALSSRNWLARAGITFHLRDSRENSSQAGVGARFFFGRGWYVGIAPVPAHRVNVGVVVPIDRLNEGASEIADDVIKHVARDSDGWRSGDRIDKLNVAGRLEHHVKRVAGDGWLLVGDATGFIDPLTGEGLHRALVTASCATDAARAWLRGDLDGLADYDRRVRSRFRSKNVLSVVLQAFLANPRVRDYALRRLDRDKDLRDVLTGALTDELPSTAALDPRFMMRLLRP